MHRKLRELPSDFERHAFSPLCVTGIDIVLAKAAGLKAE